MESQTSLLQPGSSSHNDAQPLAQSPPGNVVRSLESEVSRLRSDKVKLMESLMNVMKELTSFRQQMNLLQRAQLADRNLAEECIKLAAENSMLGSENDNLKQQLLQYSVTSRAPPTREAVSRRDEWSLTDVSDIDIPLDKAPEVRALLSESEATKRRLVDDVERYRRLNESYATEIRVLRSGLSADHRASPIDVSASLELHIRRLESDNASLRRRLAIATSNANTQRMIDPTEDMQ
eukprot:ANDGO_00106.mRNA.1 hypothetical protein